MDHLIDSIDRQRKPISAHFARRRPEIDGEISELKFQWEQLQGGFANGDLAYHTLVFRNPAASANPE
jgi:hypothetical protein